MQSNIYCFRFAETPYCRPNILTVETARWIIRNVRCINRFTATILGGWCKLLCNVIGKLAKLCKLKIQVMSPSSSKWCEATLARQSIMSEIPNLLSFDLWHVELLLGSITWKFSRFRSCQSLNLNFWNFVWNPWLKFYHFYGQLPILNFELNKIWKFVDCVERPLIQIKRSSWPTPISFDLFYYCAMHTSDNTVEQH